MPDRLAEQVVADYLAAEPTRGSSRTIVKALSVKHGLSEAKARGLLVKAGVYLAMPRDKSHVESGDRNALIAFFSGEKKYIGLIKEAAKYFGYNQGAILKFRMACDLPVLSVREVSFRQLERTLGEDRRQSEAELPECGEGSASEFESAKRELGFTSRLLDMSCETSFFSHPLWPAQLILLMVLSVLVAFAIKSILHA